MYFSNVFIDLFDLVFFSFRNDWVRSLVSGRKSEAGYDLFSHSLFKIESLNLMGEMCTLVTGEFSLIFPLCV